jgi:hypothetical protein
MSFSSRISSSSNQLITQLQDAKVFILHLATEGNLYVLDLLLRLFKTL